MSIRKARFFIVSARVKWFPVFISFPLRCLYEVIEGAQDIMSLFTRSTGRVWKALEDAEDALDLIRGVGALDFAAIDIKKPYARVKIKVLLR
jgi:hypothetical protein